MKKNKKVHRRLRCFLTTIGACLFVTSCANIDAMEEVEGESIINFFIDFEEMEEMNIYSEDEGLASEYNEEPMQGSFYENIVMIENPDDYLVLVNKNHALDPDYTPTDLRVINVWTVGNMTILLRERAATRLEELFDAAWDEGLALLAVSGYRSYETQTILHESYIAIFGQEAADRFSARPGHSEHQTGLALDVSANSVGGRLVPGFSTTPEGEWLRANAHRFGFIIRYPDSREQDTGYVYEPWHIRYVGIRSATIIFENNWILEEYLSQ